MEVESIQPEISASERIALRLAAAQMARQPSVAPPQRDDVPQTKDAAGADDSPDADAAGDVVLPLEQDRAGARTCLGDRALLRCLTPACRARETGR